MTLICYNFTVFHLIPVQDQFKRFLFIVFYLLPFRLVQIDLKLDKMCTEMKPAVSCTSTYVQNRYIESFSVLLVEKYFGPLFFDNFVTHFWNSTITSTSEHIFDIFMAEIKTEIYNIEVKQCFKSFHDGYIFGSFSYIL